MMNIINNCNKNKYLKKILAGLFCLALLFATAGCFSNYGNIRWSSEATETFRSYKILGDHKYYYSGGDDWPNAIIAIHQNYTLVPELWKEVDVTSDQLKAWVDLMVSRNLFYTSPEGFIIYDAKGNRAGIWYSMWDWTSVKMESDSRIYITTPDLTLNQPRRLRNWANN